MWFPKVLAVDLCDGLYAIGVYRNRIEEAGFLAQRLMCPKRLLKQGVVFQHGWLGLNERAVLFEDMRHTSYFGSVLPF